MPRIAFESDSDNESEFAPPPKAVEDDADFQVVEGDGQGFIAYEHAAISALAIKRAFERIKKRGDGIDLFVALKQASVLNANDELRVGDGTVYLPLGYETAVAGDFMADPHNLVSDATDGDLDDEARRVLANFNRMAHATSDDDKKLLANVIEHIRKEEQAVKTAAANEKKASVFLEAMGTTNQCHFHWWTLKGGPVTVLRRSHYVDLLTNNGDHFGRHAVRAFAAGQREALIKARQSRLPEGGTDLNRSMRGFGHALSLNLFFSHFLTDLFASGHFDVIPRKELEAQVSKHPKAQHFCKHVFGADIVAGLIINLVHDQMNHGGVEVTYANAPGRKVIAYGDHCGFDPENAENFERAIEAMAQSIEQLYDVFKDNKQVEPDVFKQHLPTPVHQKYPKVGKEEYPAVLIRDPDDPTRVLLLKKRSKNMYRSTKGWTDEQLEKLYTSDWNPVTTFLEILGGKGTGAVKGAKRDLVGKMKRLYRYVRVKETPIDPETALTEEESAKLLEVVENVSALSSFATQYEEEAEQYDGETSDNSSNSEEFTVGRQ